MTTLQNNGIIAESKGNATEVRRKNDERREAMRKLSVRKLGTGGRYEVGVGGGNNGREFVLVQAQDKKEALQTGKALWRSKYGSNAIEVHSDHGSKKERRRERRNVRKARKIKL